MKLVGILAIATFGKLHPDVTFEIDTSARQVSLERGEADMAIRAADAVTGDTLIAR